MASQRIAVALSAYRDEIISHSISRSKIIPSTTFLPS